MLISIFTPTHRDGTYLLETWESLKEQTYPLWEWIIVPNGNGYVPIEITSDPRVKIYRGDHIEPLPDGRRSIGALKRFACECCTGEIYLELDDDDLLTPNALALKKPKAKSVSTTMKCAVGSAGITICCWSLWLIISWFECVSVFNIKHPL